MNKKGFTLIELLVTIVIIGLISYIGFPSLMALINDNKTTEFEYYGKLMIDAAKLYTRKEAIDWQEANKFGNSGTEKVYIKLDDLVKEEYINKYTPSKKSISCEEDTAMIRVGYNKDNGTYTFDYKLICKDTSTRKKYTKDYDDEKFKTSNLS